MENHLPSVSPPWLEELPAQSLVLQAEEDTELVCCWSLREGQAAGWGVVSALTREQLKMKLDTSVAVWLAASPSRCGSVSPSTALTQPQRQVPLSFYGPIRARFFRACLENELLREYKLQGHEVPRGQLGCTSAGFLCSPLPAPQRQHGAHRSACDGAPVSPHSSHGVEAVLWFLPALVTRARQPWLLCRHPRRTAGSTDV